MPAAKNPTAKPTAPSRLVVWIAGSWPPPARGRTGLMALAVDWNGGAVVTDCVTGRRHHVRDRIEIAHVPGRDGTWTVAPAVRGEILDRIGEIARVRFRDGTVIHTQLVRVPSQGVA